MIDFQKDSVPVVWSISSSDSCSGTGVQADLLTFHDFNVHGCTVITALTAQNSFVQGYVAATGHKAAVAQINALDSDMPARVIKVGMVPNRELLETIIKYLQDFDGFVVYDPELKNSGELFAEAADLIKNVLLPRVDLLVVNTGEAQTLTNLAVESSATMQAAADSLLALGARSVLITGARFEGATNRLDYWSDGSRSLWVTIDPVDPVNNRGGGSTLTAALAAAIANELEIDDALRIAKAYVTQGIRQANTKGSGPGAVAHLGLPEDENDMPHISTDLATSGS